MNGFLKRILLFTFIAQISQSTFHLFLHRSFRENVIMQMKFVRSRDSSVGIAMGYGMDGRSSIRGRGK
jgi:hypothetical protein